MALFTFQCLKMILGKSSLVITLSLNKIFFRSLANVSQFVLARVWSPGMAKVLAHQTVSHGETLFGAIVILPSSSTELLVVTTSAWSSVSPDPDPSILLSKISIPHPPPVYPILLFVRNPLEQKFRLFLWPYWCKMGLSITSDEYDLLREVIGFL